MGVKVCKFGGTSLADAGQIRKVEQIIKADAKRRYIVPSAPGKRNAKDPKVTDLLYLCHAHASQQVPMDEVFGLLAQRYRQIVADLGLKLDIDGPLAEVKQRILDGASADYAASRGEYLCGLIMAELLDATFVDPAELIFFNGEGALDLARSKGAIAERLKNVKRAIVPGFYGSGHDGKIKTFSRGGSDVTGAVVAAAVGAEVYENWTDVPGVMAADPRIVDNPKTIDTITYRELRELAYMGAKVLHDEAIFPVREAGIPVHVRSTNAPDARGTHIVSESQMPRSTGKIGNITGIAGRKDFTVIALEKALMNSEIGFARRLLQALETHNVSFEHAPSGIDTMCVVIADSVLEGKLDKVLDDIRRYCQPDALEVYPHMALIATVGRGMSHIPGMAAKVFGALAEAGVNIRMIDQGSSEINIIVGVETADFEKAVQAIYRRLLG